MPKITSKISGSGSKPITDFFTRRPPPNAQRTRSEAVAAPLTPTPSMGASPKTRSQKDAAAGKSMIVSAAVIFLDNSSTTDATRSSDLRRSVRNAKKSRGVEEAVSSTRSTNTATKGTQKRKKVVNDDSDVEQIAPQSIPRRNSAIATSILTPASTTKLNSAPSVAAHPTSRKRARLSSPEPSIVSEVVPSSQSDEMDVDVSALTLQDPVDKTKVNKWLQENELVSDRSSSVPATVVSFDGDSRASTSPSSFTSGLSRFTNDDLEVQTTTTSVALTDDIALISPTPPVSNPLLPVPNPVLLSAAEKTAKLIADIKSRCAMAMDSDDEKLPNIALDDLMDTDSEDESIMDPLIPSIKAVASPIRRYDLRGKGKRPTDGSKSNVGLKAEEKAKPKPAPFIPLLKEKAAAEKRRISAGCAAGGSSTGRKAMLDEMDDENGNDSDSDLDLHGQQDKRHASVPATDVASLMTEEDQERLCGTDNVQGIRSLLDSAKVHPDDEDARPFGVPLWVVQDDGMDIEGVTTLPSGLDTQDPFVNAFASALQRGDTSLAGCIVETMGSSALRTMMPVLFRLACSENSDLGTSAYLALQRLWDEPKSAAHPLEFPSLVSALISLGADPIVMNKQGWQCADAVGRPDTASREQHVARFFKLVTLSAKCGSLLPAEVPDTLIALLLIALDPSCSQSITRDVVIAIQGVCSSISSPEAIDPRMEATISTRILKYLSDLDLVHISHVIGLFASGSGRTIRLARCIARSVLLGVQTVSESDYFELPNLLPLVDLLHVEGSSTRAVFQIRSDTNFVNMGYYVHILGVALSDVDLYASREDAMQHIRGDWREKPPKTPLQLIGLAIDQLHSRIGGSSSILSYLQSANSTGIRGHACH
ncbi:hypothetical protein ONZ45_g11126 [Pleurotus djamor]|nr:hypothetical protein ONZ45_g11126 [Pleurotus djamor]